MVITTARDDRHATAGCLLSVLLLLPLFTRQYEMLHLIIVGLVYSCVVIPIALSYIPIHVIVSGLLKCMHKLCELFKFLSTVIFEAVIEGTRWLTWIKDAFASLDSIHTLTSQATFFMVAETLICPEQRFCSLYSLLFYNILSYLKKSLKARHWAQYLQINDVQEYLRMTSTFIALKLAKAVVLTMVLMMLTLQFNHYEPNLAYVLWLEFDYFERMELYWTPVILQGTTLMMNFVIIALCKHLWLTIIASYFNVYLCYSQLVYVSLEQLQRERNMLQRFGVATNYQLENSDICAICLEKMFHARVTKCHHVFHGHCLRLCLKETTTCPLCKQNLFT